MCVGRAGAGGGGSAQPKTRAPHKDGEKGMKIVDICPKDQARQFPA